MTVADRAVPTAAAPQSPEPRAFRVEWLEWAAFASWFGVLVLWVLPHYWESSALPLAIWSALPGVLAVRPWRLPRRVLLLACGPAWAALAVAVVSPYGDAGIVSVARWTYCALLLVGATAFARTSARRTTIVAGVALLGGYMFSQAWLPWWGNGDLSHPMVGAFYAANPFGSAMLVGLLTAVGVGLLQTGRVRTVAYIVAPLCACGAVLSGSRAAMALGVAGTLVLVALGLRSQGPRTLLRAGAMVLASAATFAFLTSSVFFAEEPSSSGTPAGAKSAIGHSLGSTTGVRVDYWRAAWSEFRAEPVVGGGSGSFFAYSRLHMPAGAERPAFVHNEPLGALAEGGVLEGLPLTAFFLTALVLCAARLRGRGASRDYGVTAAAAVASAALMGHALLDMGLAFPALLAALALVLGVVLSRNQASTAADRGVASRVLVAALLLALGAAGTYVASSNARVRQAVRSGPVGADAAYPGLRDGRAVGAALHAAAARPAGPADRDVRRLLSASAPLARFDGNVQADRITLLARTGRDTEARAAARDLAVRSRRLAPRFLVPLARQIAASDPAGAADLLGYEVWSRPSGQPGLDGDFAELASVAAEVGGEASAAARCAASRFPPTATVKGRRLSPEGVKAASTASCEAWSSVAARAWEVATR